jgi:methionyl aminopeptidase
VEIGPDRWTVLAKDRRPSAHYEHTIAITDTGVDVLTDGR